MCYWLPETEKRSLEDIVTHFSEPTKKWTDIQIPKAKVRRATVLAEAATVAPSQPPFDSA